PSRLETRASRARARARARARPFHPDGLAERRARDVELDSPSVPELLPELPRVASRQREGEVSPRLERRRRSHGQPEPRARPEDRVLDQGDVVLREQIEREEPIEDAPRAPPLAGQGALPVEPARDRAERAL